MKRRDFSKGMIAVGVAAYGAVHGATALAMADGGGGPYGRVRRVFFEYDGMQVEPDKFGIVNQEIKGFNLARAIQTDKTGNSLRSRAKDGMHVGKLYYANSTLFMPQLSHDNMLPLRAKFMYKRDAWHPPRKMKRINVGWALNMGSTRGAKVVGEVRADATYMFVDLSPGF